MTIAIAFILFLYPIIRIVFFFKNMVTKELQTIELFWGGGTFKEIKTG